MADLSRNTEVNLGGLCKVYFLPIVNAPDVSIRKLSLKMKGSLFQNLPFTYETAKYEYTSKESDHGLIFSHQINFDLDNYRESIRLWIAENCINVACNLAFLDANHNLKMIGDKNYPIFIVPKTSTGEKRNDHNNTQFVAQVMMPIQARWLELDNNAGDFSPLDFNINDFK